MLDINLIRNKPEEVKNALLKRMDNVDFTQLLEWDRERREIIFNLEQVKNAKNNISKQIGMLMREGKDAANLSEDVKIMTTSIKDMEERLNIIEKSIDDFLKEFPNIPDDDVLPGGKENNKVTREWGQIPKFNFDNKNHVDLVKDLDLIDYDRGVKLGGTGFWIYKGYGALMEWALLNFFIETHIRDGYEFILPPHILTYQCGYAAGQFPKFEEDVFRLENKEGKDKMKFLLPTSETALINLHRDEILKEEELPKKYFSYTPCFRSEAGGGHANERGMIRGHQFNKVEMFQYTKPEESDNALEEMIDKAEKLVQGLGLHYRVSKLAARDCSASMAKTYDIEIWIPSMNEYKEVSSASNARDYQARRANIRFKRDGSKKSEFVNTLNASGLATSRLLPAIVEQFQQSDGSVIVPEVLRKWVGKDILR